MQGQGYSGVDLLRETRFWIRIFKEHALFMRLGFPCDRMDLIGEAQGLFEELEELENRLQGRINLDSRLMQEVAAAVSDLIDFKSRVLRMQLQCEISTSLFPLLVDHIRREAVRFLELLQQSGSTQPAAYYPVRLIQELVFWLRIMGEHIDFIRHLLDPSERELIAVLETIRDRFDSVLDTARDLRSMSEVRPEHFNRAIRFTEDIEPLVVELRDLKRQAYEMLLQCRILSIVPSPLLLDHVRREADKFLEELRTIRQHLQRYGLASQ